MLVCTLRRWGGHGCPPYFSVVSQFEAADLRYVGNSLSQQSENPFNPLTTIEFGLVKTAHVNLNIYDATGRLVRGVINEIRPAGHYSESWNGKDENGHTAVSGVYFYRFTTGGITETKKMILLKHHHLEDSPPTY